MMSLKKKLIKFWKKEFLTKINQERETLCSLFYSFLAVCFILKAFKSLFDNEKIILYYLLWGSTSLFIN
jgi:hypothetical protein